MIERGGVVPAPPDREITNNHTEQIAICHALEAMPDGWSGTVYSDSQVALGRVFEGWKLNNLPPNIAKRCAAALARLGKIEHVLLQGHPTRADLECGIGAKRGLPVSIHNVLGRQRMRTAGQGLREPEASRFLINSFNAQDNISCALYRKEIQTHMNQPNMLNAALDLARLCLQFGRVERITRHEDGVRLETDTDHTVMLGIFACAFAASFAPGLNTGLIAQFAMIHDLVEVYAGDTVTMQALSPGNRRRNVPESKSRINESKSSSVLPCPGSRR